jgi:hypothetical protein
VRFRLALALMVAMFALTGVAAAQTTSTEPTSGYTTTTPTTTTQTTPTTTTETTPTKTQTTSGQGNETQPTTAGEEQSSAVPSVAAQPAGSAPSKLAFTGAEPLLLILAGLFVAGGAATVLVRERRAQQDR